MANTVDWEQFPALEGGADGNAAAMQAMQQGDAALSAGRLRDAVTHFNTALLHDASETAWAKLVAAEISLQQVDAALEHLKAALEAFQDSLRLHFLQSTAYAQIGDIAAAEAAIDIVLASVPKAQIALAIKAGYRSYYGDYDAAYAILKPLLKTAKPAPKVVLRYARIASRFGEEQAAIRLLLGLTKHKKLPPAERSAVHFRAGDLFDKQGQYDSAFYHFAKGNSLAGGHYDPQTIQYYVDALIAAYPDMQALPTSDVDSELPIFVIGMPRSGTSLVETILSSHPQIAAAGELQLVRQIADRMKNHNPQRQAYPLCVDTITTDILSREAAEYLQTVTKLADGASRLTEKLPNNFLYLGLINQLLPGSRVIHCQRDPRDICLSCYFQNFSGAHAYTNNLQHLADYYLQYERLMNHWKSVIQLPVFTLDYSQLVEQPEDTIRALVEFCGQPWDERCLDFHKTRAAVATASSEQVRNPIYRSSLSRWKHYKRHIKPLGKLVSSA